MISYITKNKLRNFKGKTCLLRVDLNLEETNSDSHRFRATLPTIRKLLDNNIKIVIASHRGRYGGSPKSLKPFAEIFSKELDQPVGFSTEFQKPKEKIALMENLRFYKEEEEGSVDFAKKLADIADFYINDAFAVSHRENASITKITRFLPSFGGLWMKEELKNLDKAINDYKSPLTLIIGGAKVSTKIGVLENFWEKADTFLFGGGVANTFIAAKGEDVGSSLYDRSSLSEIGKYLNSKKIVLPIDFKQDADAIKDIGYKTIEKFTNIISESKTIIWNGPMGVFEEDSFAEGTKAIWMALLQNKKANIVVGGGETIAASRLISNFEFLISKHKNIFISTGGGAMLDYLSGKKLPGLEALDYYS